MRTEGDLDQFLVPIPVVQLDAAVYAFVDIPQPGARRVDHRDCQLETKARPHRRFSGNLGVPVVIAGAGRARGDHFRQRQSRPVGDEVAIDDASLKRPYDLVQPRIERLRASQPTHQRHCEMAVGIDQSRHQHVRFKFDRLGVGEAGAKFLEWLNGHNASVFDGDAEIFAHGIVRCDR